MHRERPRFSEFRFDRLPNGRCRATVVLAWPEREQATGKAEGLASPSGDLRCAAEACISALAQGVPEIRFDLLGIKAVRAFDANLVIVSLGGPGQNGRRLVGTSVAGSDLARGAVLAVLHATNRLITRRFNG